MPSAVTDSSPIRGAGAGLIPPPSKRGQKRSADEALLLTPPGTIKRGSKKRIGRRTVTTVVSKTKGRTTRTGSNDKQSRSRSRGSGQESELEGSEVDNNDEEEEPSLGDGSGRRLEFGRQTKRRRTGSLDARLESLLEDPENNPFWDDPSTNNNKKTKTSPTTELADKTEKSVRIRSPTPPVVHFRGKAPVSPPPSKKRATKTGKRTVTTSVVETIAEEPEPLTLPAPSTPKKGRKQRTKAAPVRDSPNNPFLDDDDSPFSVSGEPAEPRTPTAHAEKPTIAYVFRGVRAEFANPMYNLPSEVHERSLLPVTHPDYSPDPACPPKLLFPSKSSTTATRNRNRSASPSPSPTRASRSRTMMEGRGRGKQPQPAIPTGRAEHEHEWSDSDEEDLTTRRQLRVSPPKRLFH